MHAIPTPRSSTQWALLLLFVLAGSTNVIRAQDLVLQDARILDPETETVREASLVIRGDTIAEVLDTAPAAFDGDVVDLAGKYILPGLHDMHVHSFGNLSPGGLQLFTAEGTARRMLYAGVTGFLDLFSDENAIFALRDRQRTDGLPGADLYASGPILTCPGGHGTELGVPTRVVNTPEAARREVADLARKRPDVVKLVYTPGSARYPSMDGSTMAAVIEAAQTHGLTTVAHVETWESAREVVEAGVSAITHTAPGRVPADVLAAMQAHGTYAIPTLTAATGMADLVDAPELLDAPLLAAVTTPAFLDPLRDVGAFGAGYEALIERQRAGREDALEAVRTLAAHGIPILAGTDSGIPGTFQAYSLHRELALLVEAGLTPWQALATATTTAAAFLGERTGVRTGDRADLLVLNRSPLDDIKHTQDVALVVHHGRVVDRSTLVTSAETGMATAQGQAAASFSQTRLDDFDGDALTSTLGTTWRVYKDASLGGKSEVDYGVSDGVLHARGRLAPGPGAPGFIEFALPLNEHDAPRDVSAFDGVRVRIRVIEGPLALKLQSASVTNFDYHAIVLPPDRDFKELEIPFSDFGQLWSAPVPWTGRDVTAVALSAGSLEPSAIAFEIDRIALFKK